MDKTALKTRICPAQAASAAVSTPVVPVARVVQDFPAFTIIELLVVIAIIGLILAIAVPGLSGMQAQLDRSNAIQAIDANLTRAKYEAASTGNYVALRFMPSEWSGPVDPETDLLDANRNRMQIVTYEWKTANWIDDIEKVVYVERFEPQEEASIVRLPLNIWAAPMEAAIDLTKASGNEQDVAEEIVTGEPGNFEFDAGTKSNKFLQMDDFLIIFDQEGNLLPGPQASVSTLFEPNPTKPQIKPYPVYGAVDPQWPGVTGIDDPIETDRKKDELFTRYNFSGIALYQRDTFLAQYGGDAGSNSEKEARIDYLHANAQQQMIHPRSARLKELAQ